MYVFFVCSKHWMFGLDAPFYVQGREVSKFHFMVSGQQDTGTSRLSWWFSMIYLYLHNTYIYKRYSVHIVYNMYNAYVYIYIYMNP